MHQIFRDARDRDIHKRHADGLKPAAIARTLKISRQLVDFVLKRDGLKTPHAKRMEERNKAICQDYAFGMTMRHVAAKYDLSAAQVCHIVNKSQTVAQRLQRRIEKGAKNGPELRVRTAEPRPRR